jgi:muramoyltetrapeptide carboxypeptidase
LLTQNSTLALKAPSPLFPGATVALLCPSSPVSAQRRGAAAASVAALGLKPILFDSAFASRGYLAGSDAQRAADFSRAFADPAIDGVLALRGGYGAHRILPLIDWDAIAKHPKYFGGYSDITALHIALNQRCGLVTYHTIMPASNYDTSIDAYSMDFLKRALFGGLHGSVENPPGQKLKPLSGGRVTAPLCGGNLSVLTASLGTPFQLDTRGKILFLEDVNEPHSRIDTMVTQLRNAGLLDQCAGILLGAFTDGPPVPAEETIPLEEIMRDLLPSGKPIVSGLACGHVLPSMALPMGAVLSMDADRQTLELQKGR